MQLNAVLVSAAADITDVALDYSVLIVFDD
jgi:hypothetical protein